MFVELQNLDLSNNSLSTLPDTIEHNTFEDILEIINCLNPK